MIIKILSLIIISLGERYGVKNTNNIEKIHVEIIINSRDELINWLLFSDFGKYLISEVFSPSELKLISNVDVEINAVAIPISSSVNNLATIIQNKNPKAPSIKVLDM